jgi:hypothetical protein
VEERAVATFTFPTFGDTPTPNDWVSGEFDGEPGADVWVREHLYTGTLQGDLDELDAVADASAFGLASEAADLDGDGVDDLIGADTEISGSYHSPDGYDMTGAVLVAYGPFSGSVADWEPLAGASSSTVTAFDADGDGVDDIAYSIGRPPSSVPVGVVDAGGGEIARFDGLLQPMGDVDGDGFEDLEVLDGSETASWVFAGPFAGAFDPATHPMIVGWDGIAPLPAPDLDGDGGAELFWTDIVGSAVGVLPDVRGAQGAFDPAALRWSADENLGMIPRAGPFAAQLGEDPAADLAIGVEIGEAHVLGVYFQPLY